MSAFTISIVVGQDKASSTVRVDGSVEHLITDEERLTFGLSESQLKEAIAKYHNLEGALLPDGAYLRDPTPPHGELYRQYDWSQSQTQTTLVASSAEILDITSEKEVVSNYTFQNAGKEHTSGLTVQHEKTNTVSTTWNNVSGLSVEQNIQYNISSLGSWPGASGGEPTFSYSISWGEDGLKSEAFASGALSVELPHKNNVSVTVSKLKTIMKVRIRYTASLKVGSGAVMYYRNGYQEHNVWRSPLQKLMVVSSIPNSIETTQDIDIEHHSCTTIEIRDMKTQELISTHYFPKSVAV